MFIVKYSDTIEPMDYEVEFETEKEAVEWIETEMNEWTEILYKTIPNADVTWLNRYLDCGDTTEIYVPNTSITISCTLCR